jgi:hypothetical protein
MGHLGERAAVGSETTYPISDTSFENATRAGGDKLKSKGRVEGESNINRSDEDQGTETHTLQKRIHITSQK